MFSMHRPQGPSVFVESLGVEFEDFEIGQIFEHRPGRTMTLEEARWQSLRALDHRPAAYDDRFAEALTTIQRLPETFVFAVAAAMTTKTFGRVTANLAMTDVAFPEPVRAGDTLYSESEILGKRESGSRPDQGILHVATAARNQHGAIVCAFQRRLLVYRRGRGPYADAGY
jgi:itaconyl-CoA hydratase